MVLTDAVIEAARAGDVATVEQWLNAGGKPNERSATMGKTLLHYLASDSLLSKVRSSPGLPDPLAHLVCKFWLGSPPRRANRAATRASE